MTDDLVYRAHRLDLAGMNFAGLARLSFELDEPQQAESPSEEQGSVGSDAPKKPFRLMTGRDIKGRDEQVKDVRGMVENNGGRYVDTYDEPDTSAWKRQRVRLPDGRLVFRVIRPVFEEALKDLRRGVARNGERLDGLVVYDIDRLTRDNRDLEDAIDTVTKFHRPIIDYSGTLDLLTENGRMVARMLVAAASKQSADTSRRVKRKHQAIQQAGIPVGGTRPFGWLEDKRTLHPVESVELRRAVQRILGGASVRTIVADWNGRGVLTARGNAWVRNTVISVLRNPRMCGYRMNVVHDYDEEGSENQRVEVCFDEHGQPVIGQWEPMITVAEWTAVREIIGAHPKRGDGHNARKYLLSGTLRCGREGCDSFLRATKAPASRNKPEGFFWYACPDKGSGTGCSGLKIDGPATDDAVVKLVIALWERQAAEQEATRAPQVWSGESDLARVREDIAAAKAARKAGSISAERFYADIAEYDAEQARLIRARNAFLRQTYAADAAPVNLRQDWLGEHATLQQAQAAGAVALGFIEQRSYIEKALSAVIVASAGGRRRVPVTERLTPIPRTINP